MSMTCCSRSSPKEGWRFRFQALLILLLLAACQEQGNQPSLTPTEIPSTSPAPEQATATLAAPVAASATPASDVAEPGQGTVTAQAPAATPPTEPPTTTEPTTLRPGEPASSIRLEPVVQGLQAPTYLTHAGDERLFVTEQDGRIQVIASSEATPQLFLDISDRVGFNASEQGLLSVAFHPQYAENGYFYVNYTDNNGDTVISRFQVSNSDPNQADPGSESVVLTIPQPYRNHNGGLIKFGPDGYLYVGMGDGGSAGDPDNNAQNPGTLLGALLRLAVEPANEDTPYTVPAGNPYAESGEGRGEVWAIGVRNPWRFSFDRETGDLYVADVGQNQYEEVHFVAAGQGAGANFGWPIMEGLHCYRQQGCNQDGLLLPVVEYSHAQGGCSITGGYVYRGEQFPQLRGNYFFGDFCSGMIWSLFRSAGGAWQWSEAPVVTMDENITSFGEDQAGELYVVTQQGIIYRIRP